jgi:hypothetical protein
MKKIILIICGLFIATCANAELINGPANVRIAPGTKLLLTLNDNVEVECDGLANGWFEIGFDIRLTDKQFKRHIHIIKGDKLIGPNGEFMGVALCDFTDMTKYSELDGPGMKVNDHEMTIIAFTQKANIKPESIPEIRVSQIINENKGVLNLDKFKSLIDVNHFQKGGLLKKLYPFLTEYNLQGNGMNGPSEPDRMRLIFNNDELIAIVHSRPLNIVGVKEYIIFFTNKLMVLKTPKGVSIEAFIKKNKEAYKGAG